MIATRKILFVFKVIVGMSTIIGCVAGVLLVPEVRVFLGLDSTKPTETPLPTTPNLNEAVSTPTLLASPSPFGTPNQSLGIWIIAVGKYSSVKLAKYDETSYTSKGYHVEIFCRVSEVTPGGPVEIRAAIVGFESRDAADSEAPNIRKINPAAQIKQLDLWCPNLMQLGDYISCNYSVCP